MILGIASGKGGTGKTTVAVNLARMLRSPITLLDCDVEEPNSHLFLKGSLTRSEIVSIPVPYPEQAWCNGCGECSRFCQYKAIINFGPRPIVFPELCHGCGGCLRVCPTMAIREVPHRIGVVETIQAGKITLIQGRLDIGRALAPPLIRAVRSRLPEGASAILDAPPGTSCPVVASLKGADFVVLVTEPTPFGLYDLSLAVGMVRELGIDFGVVVNRVGIGDDRVHRFCNENRIPILLEIPNDRRVADAYSRGRLVVDSVPGYGDLFVRLIERTGMLDHGPRRTARFPGVEIGQDKEATG